MTNQTATTTTTQTLGFGSGKTEQYVKRTITYLSGVVGDWVDEGVGGRPDFGGLFTPLMGNYPDKVGAHAHDNGVWSEFVSGGKKPFDLDKFLAHLDRWADRQDQALFATAPDVVGDWEATLARSLPVLPLIREKGYQAALVAQDGLEYNLDRIPWDAFDVLFLGGGQDEKYLSPTNRVRTKDGRWVGEWKLSDGAKLLTQLALAKGKKVHMGRVNSLKRLRVAHSWGVTSADGTFLKHGKKEDRPKMLAQVNNWLDTLNGPPVETAAVEVAEVAPPTVWKSLTKDDGTVVHLPRRDSTPVRKFHLPQAA